MRNQFILSLLFLLSFSFLAVAAPSSPDNSTISISQPRVSVIFEGEETNPALESSLVFFSLFAFIGILFVAAILMPKPSSPKKEEPEEDEEGEEDEDDE